MKVNTTKRLLAAVGILCLAVAPVNAAVDEYYNGIVESSYSQLNDKDREYDQNLLDEKAQLATSSAEVLANIAEIDAEIHAIDADLAKYSSTEARTTLLEQRQRLFQKRREYKALLSGYNQQQIRMTRDLSYNTDSSTGVTGAAYANGDQNWSMGTGTGGVDDPNWSKTEKKASGNENALFRVDSEKSLKEVAEKISKKIYGSFNQEIYTELLVANHNNSINPTSLLVGDYVYLPYNIAVLTKMGFQQKALVDITMELLTEIKDSDLKRQLIKYSVVADENEESREAFIKVLISAKLNGEDSKEFKTDLTNFVRKAEGSLDSQTHNMLITDTSLVDTAITIVNKDGQRTIDFTGDFKTKVVTVSNASTQLDMFPDTVKTKIQRAAQEYRKLKEYATGYGKDDHRTQTQFRVFIQVVDTASKAIAEYQDQSNSAFIVDNRYSVDNDSTGTRSSANAAVYLRREIDEMNRAILNLTREVSQTLGESWSADENWWDKLWENGRKDATRELLNRTDMDSSSSSCTTLMNRMKVVYANAQKYHVDLYSNANFSTLRKRMIGMIGLAMAIEEIQPAFFSGKDNAFRDLTATAALQQLGIDVDRDDFDFYDRGSGAKSQFERLYGRDTDVMNKAVAIRTSWIETLARLAELNADFRVQEQLEESTQQAEEFWKDIDDKLGREWSGTVWSGIAGTGAGIAGVIIAANFWNPVGWVCALSVGATAATGILVGRSIDHQSELEKLKEYADIKIISDMSLLSLKEGNVQLVQQMLYLDEIVKGYQ